MRHTLAAVVTLKRQTGQGPFRRRWLSLMFLPVLAVRMTAVSACGDEPPPATNKSARVAPDFEPHLPLLFLEAKAPIVSEQKVACTVRMDFPQGVERGPTNGWTGVVRVHGASSQGFPKKSFGLTLNTPAQPPGLRASAHWVLNAAFIDRSLMRHKLSYDLFRSLSAPGAERFAVGSRFVEVYLNGSYHGAYLLMERMDRPLLRLRAFDSNQVAHACIYKAVDHAANFGQPGHAGYEQREPDATAKTYWQPLDEFDQFVSSSPAGEFFHAQTGIASRLDLDNAVDFHLLVLLTSNMDGITKNFLLARDGPAAGAAPPRFFFAPWDYDATFGRNWDATRIAPTAWLSNHLFDRLMGDRAYRERFSARWRRWREREFSVKSIHDQIDANARTLGEAARRNATRWRANEGSYPDKLTFAEDVAQMKSWVTARAQWLDDEIAQRNGR